MIKFLKKLVWLCALIPSIANADTVRIGQNPANSITSTITLLDDVLLSFGTDGPYDCLWETADANANALLCAGPEGGAVDVPGFIISDVSSVNVDLGFFNGLTLPFIAAISDDALSYFYIGHNQTDAVLRTNEGVFDLNSNVRFTASTAGTSTYWECGRDADDVLFCNVPTSEKMEWRIGGSRELDLTSTVVGPNANDGLSLGVSGTAFADLFLASGGVINWSAGDVTLTHAFNLLTFAGGNYVFTGAAVSGGVNTVKITPAAHTTMISEVADVVVDAHTITITGAYATQRFLNIAQPTISAASALTITNGITFAVASPTIASSAVITNQYAAQVGSAATAVSNGSFTYGAIDVPAHTVTLTGTTQVTSSPGLAALRLGVITATDSSAVTIDSGSTLYIAGPVAQAGSVTMTNKYSGWIDSGDVRFDGSILGGGGTLTLGGTAGASNNETLALDFETTANKVLLTSGSGVTSIDFGTINVETDELDLSEGNITNVGSIAVDSIDADASTVNYNDVNILELSQEDLTAGSCTLGQLRIDTGGAVKEFCYCAVTNTWYCITMTTITGPTD